jgi:hypothetical protein
MASADMTIKLDATELVEAMRRLQEALKPVVVHGKLGRARNAWLAGEHDEARRLLEETAEGMTEEERLREHDWYATAAGWLHP